MPSKADKYCIDIGNSDNPAWDDLKKNLQIGQNSLGPAFGSIIKVHHDQVRQGAYADRAFANNVAIHTLTSSHVGPRNFYKMSRWYQEDGNTQIFRLFPGEDNIRNDRTGSPRIEAYALDGWKRGDGWHEWSGRYTFIKVRRGAIFQLKHNVTYWSMQLNLQNSDTENGAFDLYYNKLRSKKDKTLLMKDVVGKSVDIRVLDDGTNHKVYVNGDLKVTNSMTDRRDDEKNTARWGFYGAPVAMDRNILILVTGAYVGPAIWQSESKCLTDARAATPVPGSDNQELNSEKTKTQAPSAADARKTYAPTPTEASKTHEPTFYEEATDEPFEFTDTQEPTFEGTDAEFGTPQETATDGGKQYPRSGVAKPSMFLTLFLGIAIFVWI